jgi:hypothetical protein
MGDKLNIGDLTDKINIKTLIEFLEYEEALTKDKESASRIKLFLTIIGIWDESDRKEN